MGYLQFYVHAFFARVLRPFSSANFQSSLKSFWRSDIPLASPTYDEPLLFSVFPLLSFIGSLIALTTHWQFLKCFTLFTIGQHIVGLPLIKSILKSLRFASTESEFDFKSFFSRFSTLLHSVHGHLFIEIKCDDFISLEKAKGKPMRHEKWENKIQCDIRNQNIKTLGTSN